MIIGIVKSLQPEFQARVPYWPALLRQLYDSMLFVPTPLTSLIIQNYMELSYYQSPFACFSASTYGFSTKPESITH